MRRESGRKGGRDEVGEWEERREGGSVWREGSEGGRREEGGMDGGRVGGRGCRE